jgi:hypothetical protein
MKKYYRTIIEIEVLSDEEVGFTDLDGVIEAITDGDCSGSWEQKDSQPVSKEEMRELLAKQGSDPDFFDLDTDSDQGE